MVKKYDPSYLRDLKSYREHRTGVLQVSKKTIKPSFLQNLLIHYWKVFSKPKINFLILTGQS